MQLFTTKINDIHTVWGKVEGHYKESVARMICNHLNRVVAAHFEVQPGYNGWTILYYCDSSSSDEISKEIEKAIEEANHKYWLNKFVLWDFKTESLIILSKFKKSLTPWERHYRNYAETLIEKYDDSNVPEDCKYALTVRPVAAADHGFWALTQAKIDFSISPSEQTISELIEPTVEQKLDFFGQTETVTVDYSEWLGKIADFLTGNEEPESLYDPKFEEAAIALFKESLSNPTT